MTPSRWSLLWPARLRLCLAGEGLGEVDPQVVAEQRLGPGERQRRPGGQGRDRLGGVPLQVLGRPHPVDEAELERLVGLDPVAEQGDLHRPRQADQPWQAPGRAGVGDQGDAGESQPEARRRAGQAKVAGERERHAGTGRHAVEHGNGRLGHLGEQPADRRVVALQLAGEVRRPALPVGPLQLAKVLADAEGAAAAGQRHGPDGVVVGGLAEGGDQGVLGGGVESAPLTTAARGRRRPPRCTCSPGPWRRS